MVTATSVTTMVTKPFIVEFMTESLQKEIKVHFPFSVTIAIIMDISQNIVGCRDQLKFGEARLIEGREQPSAY